MFCFFLLLFVCCTVVSPPGEGTRQRPDGGERHTDSTVGPGYFSFTRRRFLCSSFDFFRIICLFALAVSRYISFSFVCLSIFTLQFISFLMVNFLFLCLFSLLQWIGVAGVCTLCCHSPAQWHDIVLLVQRSCLCPSFVTTELVSINRMKNQRGHRVCWMSTSRKKEERFNVKKAQTFFNENKTLQIFR